MRYYHILILCCCLVILGACNSGNTTASDQKAASTTQKKAAPKTQAAGTVNQELHPILERLLPTCEKVEFVFYVQGMSMSTETEARNAINGFYTFVSPESIPQPSCPFEGGAVFRSNDEIVIEMDFVLSEQCRFIRVTVEGKTHIQKLTDPGYQYLMQFAKFKPSDGTPK